MLVDLAVAAFTSRRPYAGPERLAGTGVPVTIQGPPDALEALTATGPAANRHLILQRTTT